MPDRDFSGTACPVCGTGDAEFCFETVDVHEPAAEERWRVVRCTECRLVYVSPPPEENRWRSTLRDGSTYFSSDAYIARMLARIGSYRPGRLLDIGCGKGEFLHQAEKRGWDVTGVELVERENPYRLPVRYGPLDSLKLPDDSYDLITLWGVTEYLRNPVALFTNMRKMLKSGGRVLFVSGNYDSIQRSVMRVHNIPRQTMTWSKPSITSLLDRTGFTIHRLDYRNDVRNGWCTEYVTFLFKKKFMGRSEEQVLREHCSQNPERGALMLAVKAIDRIITVPLSLLLQCAGRNGVMTIEAVHRESAGEAPGGGEALRV